MNTIDVLSLHIALDVPRIKANGSSSCSQEFFNVAFGTGTSAATSCLRKWKQAKQKRQPSCRGRQIDPKNTKTRTHTRPVVKYELLTSTRRESMTEERAE